MSISFTDSSANDGVVFLLCRNGREEYLELAGEPNFLVPKVGVGENEDVSFVLRTTCLTADPLLWIQNISLEPTNIRTINNGNEMVEYTWMPSGSLFRNHFGWSNLTIELWTLQGQQQLHTCLDIFATKLNADRVRGMLHYLEIKMEDVTRSCFTATSQASSSQGAGETLLVLLQEAERQLLRLRLLMPRFQRRRRNRLMPKPVVVKMEDAKQLNDRSIFWALSHPDQLVLTSSPLPSSIPFGNRYYDLPEVESDVLYEDTDVYENQIIAGYLQSLGSRLEEVNRQAQELQQSIKRADYISVPVGLEDFASVQKEYERNFCTKVRAKCEMLALIRAECSHSFEQHLPVSRTLPEMPKMTPGFLSSSHYKELFQQITSWYRLEKLTVSGERYLYGLRTLDKLYEFFCLFRIIEALEHDGWRLTATTNSRTLSPALTWDTQPAEQYVFSQLGSERLRLFYDFTIGTRPHTPIDMIVTEFSVLNDNPIYKRRPDFIIEVINKNKVSFIVLDAKYSTRKNVWRYYIPELTMKYLHGISSTNGGASPFIALFLMYPRDLHSANDQYDLFHQQSSNLFSKYPAFPVLGATNVSPASSLDDSRDQPFPLANLLARTLAVMKQT